MFLPTLMTPRSEGFLEKGSTDDYIYLSPES